MKLQYWWKALTLRVFCEKPVIMLCFFYCPKLLFFTIGFFYCSKVLQTVKTWMTKLEKRFFIFYTCEIFPSPNIWDKEIISVKKGVKNLQENLIVILCLNKSCNINYLCTHLYVLQRSNIMTTRSYLWVSNFFNKKGQ